MLATKIIATSAATAKTLIIRFTSYLLVLRVPDAEIAPTLADQP
jgi:hypothetical protein